MKFRLGKYISPGGALWRIERLRVYRLLRKFLIGFIIILLLSGIYSIYFDTPKMARLRRRNADIERQYRILNDKILAAERTLDDMKHRDNRVYRPLLGIDTLDIAGVWNDYPEEKYAPLEGDMYSEVMIDSWRRMDHLARRMYLASVSLDDTQELAENKELFSTVIPALWPIDRTKLKYVSDPYGWGMHPQRGAWIFHEGIDLAAPVSHIWYFKGTSSRMGLLLNLSPRLLEKVLYFASYIVIDPGITIHDFRMVPGPTHTKVIFDAEVPYQCPLPDQEVRSRIEQGVRALDGDYSAVVEVEKGYV